MANITDSFRSSASEPSISSSAAAGAHHLRATSCSPYHRLVAASSGWGGRSSNPSKESNVIFSSSSFSSVLIRFHSLSTCFFTKPKDDDELDKMPPSHSRREKKACVVRPVGTPDLQIGSVVERYGWACKYQPRDLREFLCHRKRAEELLQLVIKWKGSHFIFEGPPGIGKRTMAMAFLREAFGPSKLKIKNETKKIELKGESVTSIDVNVRISSQHVEVNLSEVRGYEKLVIVALMNESHSPYGKSKNCYNRVILLHEAESISTDAQHYLCWLMEKYKGCNRIFFCCTDSSKLQEIKHLCFRVKLQPPSDTEIVEVLEFIAKKEHIELPLHLAEKIAKNSKRNLRQAIRSFEATWNSNCSLKENHEILTGWEEDIAAIAKNIIGEQSPKQLYLIRGELKNLIEHNVSPGYIFSTLIFELKKHLDSQLQTKIDVMRQDYNIEKTIFLDGDKSLAFSRYKQEDSISKFHDLKQNAHQFMRIEEFIAKFMSFYKHVKTKSAAGTKRR